MTILFKMAYRNLFRQKRRSLLTIAGMVLGYVLISFSVSLTEGTYHQIIESFTATHTGHIQIHYKDYVDVPSLYKTLKRPNQIYQVLDQDDEIQSYAPRVYSGALVHYQTHSSGVRLQGIDIDQEEKTTGFQRKISRGRSFKRRESGVVISLQLAKTLQAELKSPLIFVSQGADGSIANDSYLVRGFFDHEKVGIEPNTVFIDIDVLQEFLALSGAIHEVAIQLKDLSMAQEKAALLNRLFESRFSKEPIRVASWQVVLKEFYTAMQIDKKGNNVSLGIIILVVSIGILNTVLMSVLERTREFGVLKAVGTSPRQIFSLIIMENFFLAVSSLIIGAAISSLLILYFSSHEITLSQPLDYGGLQFSGMRTRWDSISFIVPSVAVLAAALVVSLWPGWRASQIIPVEAMRAR